MKCGVIHLAWKSGYVFPEIGSKILLKDFLQRDIVAGYIKGIANPQPCGICNPEHRSNVSVSNVLINHFFPIAD